ncbi:hypothetical protein QR680_016583 [Steinernema hermaphroditum]|uniref:BHLH domain-containing protein n=1 Tax=Steinernema hermaphroditum TaxID=289476 RepID=A0AA39HCS4_9BILA|nr:hypothetical protein QR680_016583 [Steinernema hermaphroditum]
MESGDMMLTKSEIEKKRREETAKKVEEMKELLRRLTGVDRSKAEKAEVFAEVFALFKALLIRNGRKVDDSMIPALVEPEKPESKARKPYLEKLLRDRLNYYYDSFRTLIEITNGANCTNLDKLATLERTISCIQMLAAAASQNLPPTAPTPPLAQAPVIFPVYPFPQVLHFVPVVSPVIPAPLPVRLPQQAPQKIWRPF